MEQKIKDRDCNLEKELKELITTGKKNITLYEIKINEVQDKINCCKALLKR